MGKKCDAKNQSSVTKKRIFAMGPLWKIEYESAIMLL